MSVYHGILLELLGIEKKSDNYYLNIRISHEMENEMLWKVDEYTAENLIAVTEFGEKYKYRLSFHSSWDIKQNRPISLLTQTYREQSNRIHFPCSEEYITDLKSLKSIHNIDDLDALIFTSTNKNEYNDDQTIDEVPPIKKQNNKIMLAFIASICVLFAILFSYSDSTSQNKTAFSETVLAESVPSVNVDIEQNENLIPLSTNMKTSDDQLSQDDNDTLIVNSTVQSTVPFIELEKSITYEIPKGNVALTFDDGPSPYSKSIVNILNEYEVGGTFFFIGLNVEKYPEYVEYVHTNGYSIGSHSMNHINVSNLSYEKQESELLLSSNLIEEITNEKINLFRPPYGAKNKHTKTLINEYDNKIVLWNNDPKDWKTRDADKIFSHIKNSDVSGSIILLHESQAVIDALPRIIEHLQEQDLQIINLR